MGLWDDILKISTGVKDDTLGFDDFSMDPSLAGPAPRSQEENTTSSADGTTKPEAEKKEGSRMLSNKPLSEQSKGGLQGGSKGTLGTKKDDGMLKGGSKGTLGSGDPDIADQHKRQDAAAAAAAAKVSSTPEAYQNATGVIADRGAMVASVKAPEGIDRNTMDYASDRNVYENNFVV